LNKKKIETMDDWAGVSIRSMDAEIVRAMGGTPKDIPMADLYDALNKGVVDGQMGSFEPYKSWKLGEVVGSVTVNPAPIQFSAMWYNFMNKKTWDSLPSDIQDIIVEVGREYSGQIGLAWDDQSIVGAEFVKSLGKEIYVISDEEVVKWTEAISPVIEKRLAEVAEASGKTPEEVQEMWEYFQERVDYWNGQQAANGVRPLMERVLEVIK
jgi:TRAP-type C4-dicarboxylate transport system substrate-binding protein